MSLKSHLCYLDYAFACGTLASKDIRKQQAMVLRQDICLFASVVE